MTYLLAVIFNMSMQTGEIPSIWRFAIVTPVFKKGSLIDPTNYRPISLTCISCKLLCIESDQKCAAYVSEAVTSVRCDPS